MQNRNTLREIFKNSGLSDNDMSLVLRAFDRVEFKKNDYALREGQVSNEYFFIETGLMRSYAVDTIGNDITTGFYSAGQLVLETSSFFLRTPTKETFQALSDCICWRIEFTPFQKLFHSVLPFREDGRARLVGCFHNFKQRSLSMITDPAEVRYKQLLKEHPEIIQQAPLKHIATYLGITDTSLSRIRKRLATK